MTQRAAVAKGVASKAEPRVNVRILNAALLVMGRHGLEGTTIERVAAAAGLSRVTLWRQGLTRDGIVAALLVQFGSDYREAVWPIVTGEGTGRDRLGRALEALCKVAEHYLPLLLSSDAVLHGSHAGRGPIGLIEPITRLVRDGIADRTLATAADPAEVGETLFNAVCWPYVHLRARHHWQPARARRILLRLLVRGIERG